MRCIAHDEKGRCPNEALPNELYCEKHLNKEKEDEPGSVVLRDRLSRGDSFRVMSKKPSEE